MTPEEIFSRIDDGRTLFGASEDDLRAALLLAKRDFHKYEIENTLKRNKKLTRQPKTAIDKEFYKHGRGPPGGGGRRCPTKRELR